MLTILTGDLYKKEIQKPDAILLIKYKLQTLSKPEYCNIFMKDCLLYSESEELTS